MRLLGRTSLVTAAAFVALIIIVPHLRSASALPPPTFTQTNLASDVPNMARRTDPNLVNPRGMALGLNSGLWIASNGTGKSASLDGTGQPVVPGTVTIPTADGSGKSAPTGVATNATTGFIISAGGKSAPSTELFATEDGTIAGWSTNVDPANAVIAVNNSSMGAVYKGLAIGFNRHGTFLFATNFHAGTIDMFDSNFQPVHHDRFRDSYMPAGYAPFGIASINARLYVSAALQDEQKKDDVAGAVHGFIDIFDTEGNLVKRFTSQGQLNSPWGMAWAPFEGFGRFDNALFVGNSGDGVINVFDFDSGNFLGSVSDANNKPITISGVWALAFGLGVAQSSSSTLFFTAGIGDEKHGLFGTLTVNPSSVTPPDGPSMVDPNLHVSTVVSGLDQPTGIAFLGPGDFLALEKASGKVQHVVNGRVVGTALDLAVNSASERGLLGIALQPGFAQNQGVYLYWTKTTTTATTATWRKGPRWGNAANR